MNERNLVVQFTDDEPMVLDIVKLVGVDGAGVTFRTDTGVVFVPWHRIHSLTVTPDYEDAPVTNVEVTQGLA